MKKTYVIVEGGDHQFYTTKVLEVGNVVTSKIVSKVSTQKLAEDGVPAMSVGSGNIAGASPGDEPVVRQKPKMFKRSLRQIIKKVV